MRPSALRTMSVASLLLAAVAIPAGSKPSPPNAVRAAYTPDQAGFEHFVQDHLDDLVAGQSWEWNGHQYEVVRFHRILESKVIRTKRSNRNHDPALRGWLVGHVHVKVDGRLHKGRIEANAGYQWEPSSWKWEQVLLSLNQGQGYDFVARKLV